MATKYTFGRGRTIRTHAPVHRLKYRPVTLAEGYAVLGVCAVPGCQEPHYFGGWDKKRKRPRRIYAAAHSARKAARAAK